MSILKCYLSYDLSKPDTLIHVNELNILKNAKRNRNHAKILGNTNKSRQ